MTSTDPAPQPHATAEQVEAARHDSKLAQVLYHDWEAENYDEKWSISYDQRCIDYARDCFDSVVPDDEIHRLPYDRALELGCGTGFFLLNLIQSGVARRGSVTDLSPGMVKVATRNGQSLGLDIDGRVADAERIPYDDDTFDLVVGHAVLHHIPDVELSLREVLRVLRPGGRFVFAGEPTTVGNGYARTLSTLTWEVATDVTKLPGLGSWRRPQAELDESSRAAALESIVDLHTFAPADLEKMARTPVPSMSTPPPSSSPPRCWAGRCAPSSTRCRRASWAGAGPRLRVQQLEDAELGGRQPVAPRGAEGLVLQRDDHRGQAVLNFGLDDVAYLTSDEGSAALAVVDALPLTDRGRRDRRATKAIRRPDAGVGGDGVAAPPCGRKALRAARHGRLAVHRRGAAAGQRRTGRVCIGQSGCSGNVVHDVTCSIGTELAALRGSAARAVGSDIDPVRLAMARHNLGASRRPVPRRRAAPGHPRRGGAGRPGASQRRAAALRPARLPARTGRS